MPTATNMIPPMIWMVRVFRRSQPTPRSARAEPSATITNGSPRPRQYATISATPRAAVAPSVPDATEMTPASVGPRHGVQPRANTPPSSGAPARLEMRRGSIRVSFCSAGTRPMNTRPITIVTTPPTRCSTSRLRASASIAPNTDTVASTNTTVKPATNSPAAPATRKRPSRSVLVRVAASASDTAGASAPTTPARYDR